MRVWICCVVNIVCLLCYLNDWVQLYLCLLCVSLPVGIGDFLNALWPVRVHATV